MQNTKISYLYRDANNYKKQNVVILNGCITPEQIDTIVSCLQDEEYFIPQQVGLPEERFDDITLDDHAWFELGKESFEPTDKAATENLSISELMGNFISAKDNWNDEWSI